MDAHFSEYLSAIRGMQEIYGESSGAQQSDFHLDDQQAVETDANRECIGA